MSDMTSLLMYSLYAPTWTARKLDRKATAKVKEENGVKDEVDAGNFNKLILPECPELDKLKSHIGSVRNQFYLRTAPWGEARGVRVGKAENHMELNVWFGDQRDAMQPLLTAFEQAYPEKIALAEYQLQELFDINDYPPWDIVASKFDLRLICTTVPNTRDIRVLTDIPAHMRAQIEADMKAQMEEVQAIALREAFETMMKPVAHMAAQLKVYDEDSGEKKRKIYVSLTENVQAMAQAARRLNITRDAELEKLADAAEAMVAGVTAKDLKDSDGFRVQKRKEAEKLAARIAQFLP